MHNLQNLQYLFNLNKSNKTFDAEVGRFSKWLFGVIASFLIVGFLDSATNVVTGISACVGTIILFLGGNGDVYLMFFIFFETWHSISCNSDFQKVPSTQKHHK